MESLLFTGTKVRNVIETFCVPHFRMVSFKLPLVSNLKTPVASSKPRTIIRVDCNETVESLDLSLDWVRISGVEFS